MNTITLSKVSDTKPSLNVMVEIYKLATKASEVLEFVELVDLLNGLFS
jgi:hypothetical protein